MADKENRNLFRLTRFILLKVPALFKFFARFRAADKRLLIIKTDAIGDYILFRNFIEILRTSEKYKDYRIDLLANVLCRDIALTYDSAFIDNFIFEKPLTLYYKPWQTLQLGWRLFRNNYAIVLHPTYTRNFITDGLARLTAANEIIGFEGDTEGILPRYKIKTDKFYTGKIVLPETIRFEFERTRFFFENILNTSLLLEETTLPLGENPRKGIMIFPGAGVTKREWEREKFLALIKLIKNQTAQPVYLAGGPSEIELGNYLESNLLAGEVTNLIGKTTLPQLIEMVSGASLVIANDSGAIHIAAAVKTRSVCLLGGGHFERFVPYPAYFKYAPVCVYERMDCYYCNWNCIYHPAGNEIYPCIGKISVYRAWQAVLPLLS
ncbi:MAG TPA: glycosyltransferase family 9 protein [Mucilaginibacter sp.]|nr:glycosyltransferase family 9 protein [Mucilaginibacter sp.]